MTNETTIIISLDKKESDSLLATTLPLAVGIIVSVIAWVAGKITERTERIRASQEQKYSEQIKVLWNLYFKLKYLDTLYKKYSALRQGRNSVNQTSDEVLNAIVNASATAIATQSPSQVGVVIANADALQRLEPIDSLTDEQLSIIHRYDQLILTSMQEIKELILDKSDILHPSREFKRLLFEMIKFISLYQSIRETGDTENIPTSATGASYPTNISHYVETRIDQVEMQYLRVVRAGGMCGMFGNG